MADQKQIPFERMLDWLEGRLTENEAAQVAAAIERADPAVQDDLHWLRTFLAVSQEIELSSPPAAVHDDLMQRFEEHSRRTQTTSLWQRLMATLTFDSNLASGLAGARGVTNAGPRQLIYGSDYADIVLNVRQRPEAGNFDLMGQVLPHNDDDTPVFTVQLLDGDREIDITSTDELGEFIVSATADAAYALILSADDMEIQIAPLNLTAG